MSSLHDTRRSGILFQETKSLLKNVIGSSLYAITCLGSYTGRWVLFRLCRVGTGQGKDFTLSSLRLAWSAMILSGSDDFYTGIYRGRYYFDS